MGKSRFIVVVQVACTTFVRFTIASVFVHIGQLCDATPELNGTLGQACAVNQP
jgi:hypothetical protein